MGYPTKEQILQYIETHQTDPSILVKVREWKEQYYTRKWGEKTKEDRIKAIEQLIFIINNKVDIIWINMWCYAPLTKTINGDKNSPSIISALHEVGHSLNGDSELEACGFSINIFQTCFPNEFRKLEWNGHMLVKKQQ